jgi:hypothetical protein
MRLAVELGVLLLALEGVVHAQVRTIFHTRAVRQISADPFASPNGAEPDTEVEPDVAIDPNDPDVVVAVFQQGRFDTSGGCVDPGFATSQDGGATWTTGSLPGLTVAVGGPFDRASDPAVAIGADGAVYAQTLPFDVRDCRSGLAVQRSDDHGVSFNAPVLVQDDSSCSVFNDKNWIAVDTFPGSPHHGRVYSAWDRIDAAGQPILTSHSDDGGQTWSAPVNVSGPFFPGGIGVIPLVQPTGDLTLLYTTVGTSASEEVAQMSHDGGATFGGPVAIATLEGTDPPGMRTGAGLAGAAVDPVTGHLYAVWQDRRFRADGLNDVVLSVSADGGASWAPLRVVSESGPVGARDHFTPNVAAFGGTVLIVYGIRLHGGNRLRMRYIVSPDGGATFAREGGLGHGGNLDFAATANGVRFLGDYLGVTVSATAAHAVWCLPSHPRGGSADPMHQVTFAATFRR